jgi:hydrogenase-4 component E
MLSHLSLYEQAIFVLAALLLYTCFSLLAHTRLLDLIRAFAWQGVLLAATCALVAWVLEQPHLYISAILTLSLKGFLIPFALHRLVIKLKLQHTVEKVGSPTTVLLSGVGLVIFSYYVALPIEQLSTEITRNVIAISLAMVLLGMLLLISRSQAVSQVVGFMAVENGLFFAAVVSTYGMPMVVELGVAFDVLVAMVLFGVFFFQIKDNLDSLDVDQMNRLSEVDE